MDRETLIGTWKYDNSQAQNGKRDVEREKKTRGLAAQKVEPTSAGLFFKHRDTISLRGREKCSSS